MTPGALGAPPTDVVVRELRWSDFDALTEAYYLLYDERTLQDDIGITLFRTLPSHADEVAWFAGLYRKVLSGEAIVAIAERGGKAVGQCTVGRVGGSEESESSHVGELGILVHRDQRGAGVGSALLTRVLDQCRGKFEVVRLSVFSTNVRARRLYERFGFVYIGTRPRVVLRGGRYFDEDLMVRDVGMAHPNR